MPCLRVTVRGSKQSPHTKKVHGTSPLFCVSQNSFEKGKEKEKKKESSFHLHKWGKLKRFKLQYQKPPEAAWHQVDPFSEEPE